MQVFNAPLTSLFFRLLLLCFLTLFPIATASGTPNTTLTLNPPPPLNASTISAPRIPNLITDFTFQSGIRIPPLQVYQTAIRLMYDLAQLPWDAPLLALIASHIEGYHVLMMFVNPQLPGATPQLLVQHCVDALFRAITIMTDGILFCQLRCRLSVGGRELGAFTVATTAAGEAGGAGDVDVDMVAGNKSVGTRPYDRGHVVDPDNFLFVIEYRWYNKAIKPKELSLALLDALAQAAMHDKDAACQQLEAVSPQGGCGIFVDRVFEKPVLKPLTYAYVTRALRLLFDKIVVPQKRWGDVYLKLVYNEEHFGDVRVLRFEGGKVDAEGVVGAR